MIPITELDYDTGNVTDQGFGHMLYKIIPPQPLSPCSTSVKYHPGQTSVSSTVQNMNIRVFISLLLKIKEHLHECSQ